MQRNSGLARDPPDFRPALYKIGEFYRIQHFLGGLPLLRSSSNGRRFGRTHVSPGKDAQIEGRNSGRALVKCLRSMMSRRCCKGYRCCRQSERKCALANLRHPSGSHRLKLPYQKPKLSLRSFLNPRGYQGSSCKPPISLSSTLVCSTHTSVDCPGAAFSNIVPHLKA